MDMCLFARKYPGKYITGKVYEDIGAGTDITDNVRGVPGITVKLYSAKKVNLVKGTDDDGVSLYSEKLIMTTKTNENGEYRFYVKDGTYSVSIDLGTLPEGKGVTESNTFIERVTPESVNFIIRDIYSIDMDISQTKRLFIGEPVVVNPTLRDQFGCKLTAKVKCSSDDAVRSQGNILEFKPGNFEGKWVNLNVTAGNVYRQFPVEVRMPEAPLIERINIAYKNGIIDEKAKILLYLYAMFDRNKISRGYGAGERPIKSGTVIMEEILDYIRRKDADSILVETAKRYIGSAIPSLDKEYRSPGGFFKIHYTTIGVHAVSDEDLNGNGVPDYIEKIASSFDEVKNITCNTRRFRTPIVDLGKDALDVYVYNLDGKYGVTVASRYYGGGSGAPRRASSYICIDNNYSSSKGFKLIRDDCMRVTVAHEFFHSVQYAYNLDADKWWKEASATWNEDEIYSSVNDYVQYLKNYFSNPQKSLEENTYSRVLFAKYLSEKWGGYEIIRRIWEIQATRYRKSINAIDAALKERFGNEDIGSVFDGFTAWNFNPAQYYKEGTSWNESVSISNTYSEYPVPEIRGTLNHLASNYQLFKLDNVNKGKTLKITIDGMDKYKWGFKIQKRRISDGLCDITGILSKESSNRAEIIIKDTAEKYSEICLIPANLEKEKDGAVYSYSANFME
jgi:hypothetical protein